MFVAPRPAMLGRITCALPVLAIACASNTPSPGPNAPTANRAAATQPATIAPRADAFVDAWRKGSKLDEYLAAHVTITWRGAADEPSGPTYTLASAAAATRLADPSERFIVGDKRECDARCCHYNTSFVHGDTTSAVSSVCFAANAVASIEATH